MASGTSFLEMMKVLQGAITESARDIPKALSAPGLNRSEAEKLLKLCLGLLDMVDQLYDEIDQANANDDLDDEQDEAAGDAADTFHEIAQELMLQAFDAVRRLGGNPSLIVDNHQRGLG